VKDLLLLTFKGSAFKSTLDRLIRAPGSPMSAASKENEADDGAPSLSKALVFVVCGVVVGALIRQAHATDPVVPYTDKQYVKVPTQLEDKAQPMTPLSAHQADAGRESGLKRRSSAGLPSV
jgi:hypothetical protein